MRRPAPLPLIWLALITLTAFAVLAGHVSSDTRLARWEVALLLGLSLAKARLVLAHYLELPRASLWYSALFGSTGALMIVILGLALLA